jgi:hypothetical protein
MAALAALPRSRVLREVLDQGLMSVRCSCAERVQVLFYRVDGFQACELCPFLSMQAALANHVFHRACLVDRRGPVRCSLLVALGDREGVSAYAFGPEKRLQTFDFLVVELPSCF